MNSNENGFLVSINCLTYNQSEYITDAMNGFVIQKTSFPYVAIIIDDSSTDNEQKVISSYLEEYFDHSDETGYKKWETEDANWTYARHKENENCYFVVVFLKKNLFKESEKKNEVVKEWMQTKYLALCEGDDYWADPLKLQKQVDFMESHPDYSICYHHVKILNALTNEFEDDDELYNGIPEDFSIKELAIRNCIHTNSVLYRNDVHAWEKVLRLGTTIVKDYANHMFHAEGGLIKRLPDIMGVYRKGVGVWSRDESFLNKNLEWVISISKTSALLDNPETKKIIERQINNIKTDSIQYVNSIKDQVHSLMSSNEFRVGQMFTRRFPLLSKMIIKIGNRHKQKQD